MANALDSKTRAAVGLTGRPININKSTSLRGFLSQRFSGEGLEMAIAIAMAESGGNAKNHSTNGDGSIDRGLFQINSHWHSEVNDKCAYDASCNAQAAARISKGGKDWHEWSTYGNGAYRQYYRKHSDYQLYNVEGTGATLPGAGGVLGGALGNAGSTLGGLGVPDPLKGIEAIGAFFNDLGSNLWGDNSKHFWLRVGRVTLGVTALLIGLAMMGHVTTMMGPGKALGAAGKAAKAKGGLNAAAAAAE